MKKARNSLVCTAGHPGSGPFCLAVSVPLQTSIFLGAMDSTGQPQGLKEMDRRQHFDCWGPHIAINKVLPTEILLETPFDSSKYFGTRKSELLQTVTEKQAFALYIGYIFYLFASELCGSLWLPSRLNNVYWEKKIDTWYHQRQDSMKLYTLDKIHTEFICRQHSLTLASWKIVLGLLLCQVYTLALLLL